MNTEAEKLLRTIPKSESEAVVQAFEVPLFALQSLVRTSGFFLLGNWQPTAQAACENRSPSSIPIGKIHEMSYYSGECGALIRVTVTL